MFQNSVTINYFLIRANLIQFVICVLICLVFTYHITLCTAITQFCGFLSVRTKVKNEEKSGSVQGASGNCTADRYVFRVLTKFRRRRLIVYDKTRSRQVCCPASHRQEDTDSPYYKTFIVTIYNCLASEKRSIIVNATATIS